MTSSTTQHRKGRTGTAVRTWRWIRSLPLVAWRYLGQRVPTFRRDREDDQAPTPDLDRHHPGDPATIQRAADGVGHLFHRRYWIHVTDEKLGPEQLIDEILDDPNRVAPTEMARFETADGRPARGVELGDELIVRLPGPWEGPVRVVERTPVSFCLVTLKDHMEAGEIQFRFGYDERGFLRFEIESWARSGDPLFDWIYERVPIGREMQMQMWSQFCQRVADFSGGVRMSNVAATTRRLE